jgi:hypothetical protein
MKKLIAYLLTFLLFTLSLKAAEPLIWKIDNRADVLKGDSRGVSIDDNGTIRLAPKLNQLYNSEQSTSGRARSTRPAISISEPAPTAKFTGSTRRAKARFSRI